MLNQYVLKYKQYVNNTQTIWFAHTVQLVIKDRFKQAGTINKEASKVSTIVSHVHRSIPASVIFWTRKTSSKCYSNSLEFSTEYGMINLKSSKKLDSLDTLHLIVCDCKTSKDLNEILIPFKSATQCIQGDNSKK